MDLFREKLVAFLLAENRNAVTIHHRHELALARAAAMALGDDRAYRRAVVGAFADAGRW